MRRMTATRRARGAWERRRVSATTGQIIFRPDSFSRPYSARLFLAPHASRMMAAVQINLSVRASYRI
ncbi:MAG TPA: hypothetical protein VK388_04390 [Pyrinomonadaceae bacterium]|nr:hypothetical protein [Pyrinomonadaceae bacterium]